MIRKELEIEVYDTYFWTDSILVLRYINSRTTRFKTFVANRLGATEEGSLLVAKIQKIVESQPESQKAEQTPQGGLTLKELQAAEKKILQHVQSQAYADEIRALAQSTEDDGGSRQKIKGVTKTSSIYRVDQVINGELLRVGGRLSRASLPVDAKHPIILPKASHVSTLIIRRFHETSGHCGRNHVLASLQQKYWISGANSAIRKVVGKCVMCRRSRAKFMEQKMADLPADRIKPDEPPFTRVGMDCFGPLEVKRGRSVLKRYGVIFTCVSSRAVHLEKADSLDTDSCTDAMRRFIARRGNVTEMRSDNGTNLVVAERELRTEINKWNQAQLNNALLQRNIQWTFNPPGGSHHGGVWERQIRTVRKLLFSLMKQQTLTDESLHTLLCEVESIINSRPLTRVSDDVNDLEALTPNHLLLLKSTPHSPQLPPVVNQETDVYARRRWRQVQYLSDVFWRRWVKEYLPQLQERHKWVRPQPNVGVGDLVLVVDTSVPRNLWPLGRVVRTMPDVRSVEVKTNTNVYRRPITELCLLLEADP
ncbi:uncharacterized protein LOC119733862 [Patiria miniata]|uniref:Integrase catalytic domain-containing protein n=1 Tax=Patiria miniata TaxID=46514 RepID=A0A914AHZ0_PATMI|nr:uncharacterized protein LOC119733862 [Patiria miniata]